MLKKCARCPADILCVPQIQCPAHVYLKDHEKPQVCDLPGGKFGFCCVTGQNHTGNIEVLLQTIFNDTNNQLQELDLFTAKTVNKSRRPSTTLMPSQIVEEGRSIFQHLMHQTNVVSTAPGHPEFVHGMVFHSSLQEDLENFHLSNSAMEQLLTTQVYSKK